MSVVSVGGGHQPGAEHPVDAVATMISTASALIDIPPDPDWHDDSVLLAELATLNRRVAQYVTRMLDADAMRTEPVSPADEAALGRALVEFGERLGDRSRHQPPVDVASPAGVPSPRDDQVR
jgi:hypothetical protein